METTLHSGVILRLLENMGIEKETDIDDCYDHKKKPVLLQIRSIIPVLEEEDDLWPKQGFFIKVSDSTHAIYVSFPQEGDEMVLCNELQLGQLIYAEKLEVAYPVPMLKGVRPIPGRQPCHGDPKVLDFGTHIIEDFFGVSKLLMQERKKNPIDYTWSPSHCKVPPPLRDRRASIGVHNCGAKTPDVDKEGFNSGYSCIKSSLFVDKVRNSDSMTFVSRSRRRSWCGIAETSPVIKHDIIPFRRRTPTSFVSAVCGPRYGNSNSRTRTRDISQSVVKTPNRIRNSSSARSNMELLSDEAQTELLWDSLPSSLAKIGKEVVRQRDAAVLAAVEALQEAAATERLLRCLSTYSELRLEKSSDQQPSINKFLKLQDYLAQCRTIVHLSTDMSPLRTANTDNLNSHGFIKEAVNRERNAAAWIKAAVASDLSPLSERGRSEANGRNKPSQVTNLEGTYTIRKQRNMGECYTGLLEMEAEKQNDDLHAADWEKGSRLSSAGNLARCLHEECKTWFVAYVENYLDGLSNKFHSSKVGGEAMRGMKRVNDWLDMVEKEEGSELEAYERVRKKIYRLLLKHAYAC